MLEKFYHHFDLSLKIQQSGVGFTALFFLKFKKILIQIFVWVFFLWLLFFVFDSKNFIVGLGVFFLIFILPDLYLHVLKEKRLNIIKQAFPYFIDLLIFALRSGKNLDQALDCVLKSFPGIFSEILSSNFQHQRIGIPLETTLKSLQNIIPTPEFQHFVSTLNQSQKLGVSLAVTLEIQTNLAREKQKQRAEELSRMAATKISLPLVFFIFPALLILYIAPGILFLLGNS